MDRSIHNETNKSSYHHHHLFIYTFMGCILMHWALVIECFSNVLSCTFSEINDVKTRMLPPPLWSWSWDKNPTVTLQIQQKIKQKRNERQWKINENVHFVVNSQQRFFSTGFMLSPHVQEFFGEKLRILACLLYCRREAICPQGSLKFDLISAHLITCCLWLLR